MKPGNTNVPTDYRAIGDVLGRVGDKWTAPVVISLSAGPMRYSKLRRALAGISQRMLTLNLRALERDGLVKRTVYPTVPPQVEYELTPLGRSLVEPLLGVADWARHNWRRIELARRRFDANDPRPSSGTSAWSGQRLAEVRPRVGNRGPL